MKNKFNIPLGYLNNKNILSLFNINQKNTETDPDFVVYDTTEFLPVRENKKHFASLASILSVENGYFGTRSCLEECICDIGTSASYIAGVYMVNDDLITDKLAVMPDWTRMEIFLDDSQIDLLSCEILQQIRGFDIKRGVSFRIVRLKDDQGRITRIKTEKFASLKHKNIGCQYISVIPENYSAKLTVRCGIDASIVNVKNASLTRKTGSDFIKVSVEMPEEKFKDGEINPAKTVCMTRKTIFHSQTKEYSDKKNIPARFTGFNEGYTFEEYEINTEKGKEVILKSIVSIFTTIDCDNPEEECIRTIHNNTYQDVLNDHCEKMEKRLNESGVKIGNDPVAQRYANYSVARLIMAGENNSEKTSIAARTLTGPSYAGHVFWDNEIFDLPFFTFTNPLAAKKMLMYRYNTIEGAKENRQVENEKFNTFYKGARFAWESTSSGKERTPVFVTNDEGQKIRIFTGTNEKHITPDIAYAVYQYWLTAKDDEFLKNYGAELVFETARYSGSILKEGDDGKLHLYNVIGPDEYHEECSLNPLNGLIEGVNDNAYTNIMISNNLEIAVKISEYLKKHYNEDFEKLKSRINIKDSEIQEWEEKSKRIYINQDEKTGIIEQFEGYHNLKEADLDFFRKKYGEVKAQKFDKVLKHETIHNKDIDPDKNNYKILKQPDVLMLLTLLPEKFAFDIHKANYKVYEPRTSHGSSLSAGMHSLMAARLGLMGDAYKYYLDTGGMDIDNVMGNAANGIHAASLGATWQALVMGFGGMQLRENFTTFNPNLPQIWNKLSFCIIWNGQKIKLSTKRNPSGEESLFIKIAGNNNCKVPVKLGENEVKKLVPGKVYSAVKTSKGWKWDIERTEKALTISELASNISKKFKTVFLIK